MDLNDVIGQEPDRIDRIAHPVEDHVRGIEVDADVLVAEFGEGVEERGRGLLARLETDANAVIREHVGEGPEAVQHDGAGRIARLVGMKPAWRVTRDRFRGRRARRRRRARSSVAASARRDEPRRSP